MESHRRELDRKQGEGSRRNKGKEKEWVHVEQETMDSWESSHAPMQRDVPEEVEEIMHVQVERRVGAKNAARGLELLDNDDLTGAEMQGVTGDSGAELSITKKDEGEGSLLGRRGWSVRRWKRKARESDVKTDGSQQLGLNLKKRKGPIETVGRDGNGEKKKRRGEGKQMVQDNDVLAVAARQPRHTP
jgi:hypothetical protein